MEGVKLTIALIIAVLLQWTLRNVAEPFAYIDFPLIIVVYAALQRNSIKAILFGTLAGIAVDALSGGLLGANGFAKTLIAYIVSEIARRVYMDNLLLRIPVIAGACLLNDLVYYGTASIVRPGAGRAFLVVIAAYTLIGTTIAGTLVYLLLDSVLTEQAAAEETRYVYAADGRRGGVTRSVLNQIEAYMKLDDISQNLGLQGRHDPDRGVYPADAARRAALLPAGRQGRVLQRACREPAGPADPDPGPARRDLRPQRQAAGRFAADLQCRPLERADQRRSTSARG